MDLSQINLEVHTYKMDKDLILLPYNKTAGSFPSYTPLLSAYAYEVFVDIATQNEAIYKQAAKEEKAKVQKN